MRLYLKQGLFLLLSFLAAVVYAGPQVELSITVEKEVISINEQGEKVTERAQADEAIQGETLYYTIHYKNSGDETATNVQLDNPVAEGTSYVADSAWGDKANILFTLNGKEYQTAAMLKKITNTADGKTLEAVAAPEDYSAIRWLVKAIDPGAEGRVGFTASVN